MTQVIETPYRCPGETHSISSAVHLGRLSSFYEGCRNCPHRTDIAGLPERLQRRLAEAIMYHPGPVLEAEGIAGLYGDQVDAALVRRYTSALGIWLRQQTPGALETQVLLAGDDRPLTADLVAAASDGLRYAGCDVVDLGGATAASLAHEVAIEQAAAGVLVGNTLSKPRTASLSLWLDKGQPLSGCGQAEPLEEIWNLSAQPVVRPGRRYGGWRRGDCRLRYSDRLAPCFHALRPLQFVLDTGCLPLKRILNQLLATVACRRYSPGDVAPGRLHFHAWIDGNGELLRLSDEHGQTVASEDFFGLLARRLHDQEPGATVVVEQETSPTLIARLHKAGLKAVSSPAMRASMHAAMLGSQARLGGGPSGRIWFAGPAPAADALEALTQLLVILSQSDRPLSQILAD